MTKKQQHPLKQNQWKEKDKWIIGGGQKKYENVRIIIICTEGLVLEDGWVIGFQTKTLEDGWLKYNDYIIWGHSSSVFTLSGNKGRLEIEKTHYHT